MGNVEVFFLSRVDLWVGKILWVNEYLDVDLLYVFMVDCGDKLGIVNISWDIEIGIMVRIVCLGLKGKMFFFRF